MEISFKEMKLDNDEITVKTTGEAFGYKIPIKLSILQLAKIFGTDREVGEECESIGFGSQELEEKCEETKELIKKFPDIRVWNNEVKFDYTSVEEISRKSVSSNPNVIQIYAEDIVGWNNEGILTDFPKELYDKELKCKKFEVSVKPFSVIFDIGENSK